MALSKLAVRRLTKLAEFMAKLPKSANKHFDMTHWFQHDGLHQHKIGNVLTRKDLQHCGTAACAFGWAATIPEFRKAGLTVKTRAVGDAMRGTISTGPAKFFGLSIDESDALFFAFDIKTPKQWAKHCRKFLRDNA
jgi:hypothetical protein